MAPVALEFATPLLPALVLPYVVPALVIVGLIAIASSSGLYTWIWFQPRAFIQYCVDTGTDPCDRMALMAHTLKVVQFSTLAATTDWLHVQACLANPWLVIPGAVFFAAGQHLNVLVYARLGFVGVYYGVRFGRDVPWVTGWPYSHIRDPQYVGAIMSLIAVWILGANQVMLGWWLLNYLYLILLESSTPEADPPSPTVDLPAAIGRLGSVPADGLTSVSVPPSAKKALNKKVA